MPELIALQGKRESINIAQKISVHWQMVGTALLDDKDGTIVPAIAQTLSNNVDAINMNILTRWVQGKGIADCTWHGLLGVLKLHCKALAVSVEEALTVEWDRDTEQGKQLSRSVTTSTAHMGIV